MKHWKIVYLWIQVKGVFYGLLVAQVMYELKLLLYLVVNYVSKGIYIPGIHIAAGNL